jgi:inward rectifier potassium channel
VGNERRGRIVGAVFTLTLMRSVRSAEGVTLFRSVDVPLVRARAPALSRSWNVLHRIDRDSPLFGETPGSLAEKEAELTLEVFGTDDTTLQAVHASNVWSDRSFAWGARLADVITETPEGNLELDVRRFHEVTPTEPTADFPYPAAP